MFEVVVSPEVDFKVLVTTQSNDFSLARGALRPLEEQVVLINFVTSQAPVEFEGR